MLEIILIFVCARKIGAIVAAKGRTKIGYQLMLVGLWIGGEFAGAFLGVILQMGSGEPQQAFSCMIYICALIGAAVGAGIAFAIANSLSPIESDDFYRGGDDYRRGLRGPDDHQPRDWRGPDERQPGGDEFTDRPAPRREDDRIQE